MKTRPCHSQCLSLSLRAATSTSAKRTTVGRRCGDESEDTPKSQPVPLSRSASSDFYIGQKDDRRRGDESEDTPMSQPVPLSQSASSDFYIGQKDDRRAKMWR